MTTRNPEREGAPWKQDIIFPVGADPLAVAAVICAMDAWKRGVRESGGANRGPEVEQYQLGWRANRGYLLGERWCAAFVRYVYEKGASDVGLISPFVGWRRADRDKADTDLASATKWLEAARWLEGLGQTRLVDSPAFGDVGLFVDPNHVVLVVDPDPGPAARARAAALGIERPIVTIEGNFQNRVEMVLRDARDFRAFVRVVGSTS